MFVVGACGSGEETATNSSAAGAGSDMGPAAEEPAATADQAYSNSPVASSIPDVTRTREGNGGIIAVAGEMTMEFDYSPPQGNCRASDGKFEAKGIDIHDDTAGVTIKYETVVAPDTGRLVGSVLNLEVGKDGYVQWVASVGIGRAGSVDETSYDVLPAGGVTLVVTGTMAGFQKNRAPTGIKAPFRLEATCGL